MNLKNNIFIAIYCIPFPRLGFPSLPCVVQPSAKYNYKEHGFDWRDSSLDKCAGNVQSPIDVDTTTLKDAALRPNKVGAVNLNGFADPTGRLAWTTPLASTLQCR